MDNTTKDQGTNLIDDLKDYVNDKDVSLADKKALLPYLENLAATIKSVTDKNKTKD